MKHALLLAAALTALTATAQSTYKAIVPMPGVEAGTMTYLYNYDTGEKFDSVAVKDGAAVFTGDIDEPIVVRIIADDQRYGSFILEEGTTAFNQTMHRGVGSMYNDMYNALADSATAYDKKYSETKDAASRKDIIIEYIDFLTRAIEDNLDNPISLIFFNDYAYYTEVPQMLAFVGLHSELKNYARVRKIVEGASNKLAYSAGKPYADFEATYDGSTKRLSDYVGKGKHTLVDFFASWCGPCMREIPVIKELREKYESKGLQVVGVAVWDKPEDTLACIDRMQIPWDCIINTGNEATDLYGIQAIPCIMLIDPQGTIVFRDLQGEELKATVAKALQ
ncbi:MAG: AhpC/TSA family protein [Clostridium sp.]|nr:AhpC/TSA family protein [Clostridium sp.]